MRYLTLTQAAAAVPGRVHPYTVLRWIIRGCRARDGRRVMLGAVKCGGRWRIPAIAIEKFLRELNPPQDLEAHGTPPVGLDRLADARRRRQERTLAACRALGLPTTPAELPARRLAGAPP